MTGIPLTERDTKWWIKQNQQIRLKAEKVVDCGHEGGNEVMTDSLYTCEVNAPCTS